MKFSNNSILQVPSASTINRILRSKSANAAKGQKRVHTSSISSLLNSTKLPTQCIPNSKIKTPSPTSKSPKTPPSYNIDDILGIKRHSSAGKDPMLPTQTLFRLPNSWLCCKRRVSLEITGLGVVFGYAEPGSSAKLDRPFLGSWFQVSHFAQQPLAYQ